MKTAFLSALSLSLFIRLPLAAEETPAVEYRVTDVAGEAGFVPKGETKISPVVNGLALEEGDRLVTGKSGRVEFATKAGTVMELKENSDLKVENFSGQVSKFFLKVGRLFGKFASAKKVHQTTSIRSPITVAAIRGTELAFCVEENGETQAGVLEGVVAFTPFADTIGSEQSSQMMTKAEEVVVEKSEGFEAKPNEKAQKLSTFPPIVVKDLVWFQNVRDRVPLLRDQWKDIPEVDQIKLRQDALRERVKWSPPEKINPKFTPPPKPGDQK